MGLDFPRVKDLILPQITKDVSVIAFGLTACPFSERVKDFLKSGKDVTLRDHALYVEFTRNSPTYALFKNQLKYHGTYPIVFVEQDGEMVHIGGSDEFFSWLDKRNPIHVNRLLHQKRTVKHMQPYMSGDYFIPPDDDESKSDDMPNSDEIPTDEFPEPPILMRQQGVYSDPSSQSNYLGMGS